MSPHETLFRLESTNKIVKTVVDHTPLCRFVIWDFPGDYFGSLGGGYGGYSHHGGDNIYGHYDDHPDELAMQEDYAIFSKATALIFVMDAQDEPYDHVLQNLTETVTRAYRANPQIAIEVFINKVDGELFLSDEAKYDCRRDIMQAVAMELAEANLSDVVPIAYYLTSIYDHSIFEALSKVSQKLISQLPTLENLLNVLVSTCSMEKAFLFDVASKLYICTDSSPIDMQAVELCSDMIDVVLDVSGIYGMKKQTERSNLSNGDIISGDDENSINSLGALRGIGDHIIGIVAEDEKTQENEEASAYDSESASVIHLSNGIVLYLKEVDSMLALVCLTRSENFTKKSLINYNIRCLKMALKKLI